MEAKSKLASSENLVRMGPYSVGFRIGLDSTQNEVSTVGCSKIPFRFDLDETIVVDWLLFVSLINRAFQIELLGSAQ